MTSTTPATAPSLKSGWPFPRIRILTLAEIEPIMAMCRRMWRENGLGPEMDEALVRDEVSRILSGERTGIVAAIGDADRIEGSICLVPSRLWYAQYWWLEDRWHYVLPEHRRSDNARQLIRFAKWLAEVELGIPLMLSILNNERTETKVRLYQRELGPPAGAFFLYGTRTGQH